MPNIRTITIFFASAIDGMEDERQNLNTVSDEIGNLLKRDNIFAKFIKWENFMKLEDYQRDPEGCQARIDQSLRESDISLFLFKSRVGKVTKHEFDVARILQKENKNHKLFVCCLNVSEEERDDSLTAFQQQLADAGIDWEECRDLSEVKRTISFRVLQHLGISLPATPEIEAAEQEGERLFSQYKADSQNQELLKPQLHNVIDTLLAQVPIIMDTNTDSVVAKVVKAIELYYKADRWASKTDYDKEKYSDLLVAYARFLYDYGMYNDAMNVYLRQIPLAEELYGKEHENTAASYNNIGEVYRAQGDYPKALEFYGKALAIDEKVLGTDHPLTATSYNNIGLVYKAQGDFPKALEYLGKALAIREKGLGTEHPDTANSYNNIGAVYNDIGYYPSALEYHGKALVIFEKVLGKEHPDTAKSYNNIGMVYKAQSDYPQALKYYGKALAIREKVLGTEHPDTANSYNNIGLMYDAQGNYPKALEYYKKALVIREKVLGEEHSDTAVTYNNIGLGYYKLGDYPQALEYYVKALEILKKGHGTEHPLTATAYNNIGLVYEAKGDYPKALEYLGKALAIREKGLGTEHPDTAISYINIGAQYYQIGKFPETLGYFEKALKIFKASLGDNHPNTQTVQEWLDLTKAAMGKKKTFWQRLTGR